jgi:hypothetical protein
VSLGGTLYTNGILPSIYDTLGRVYRIGLRFKM